MKIVGIGDLLIPSEYIKRGFQNMENEGFTLQVVDWKVESEEALQHINLMIEQHGSEAYEPPAEILNAVKDADIIITQFCPITKKVIDSCISLKAIGVLRGGVENVNVDYASQKSILVFNTPGRNANAVADFTVGMLLAECRNIARSHMQLKEGKWIRDYSNKGNIPDLAGKRAGIIGYGNIGRKVAKRLKAFDMDIVAYDPYIKQEDCDVKLVSLETLFETSDFVCIHYRLTKETEKMITRELIGRMKPTAYLINTARSGLVDEDALADALNSRRIAGAAIDVFDEEPPGISYKLVTPENVTITPHLAGTTKDAFTGSPYLLSEDMIKLFNKSGSPRFIINAESCTSNVLLKERV